MDSAIWYLEAALNYSLTTSWVEYSNLSSDSLVVGCTLNQDGTIDESEVIEAFNDASDVLEEIPNSEQHLVVIDVQGSAGADELILLCMYNIGSDYGQSLNTTFGPTEDYMWWAATTGQSSGCPCEDNPNPISYCADYYIQRRINLEINGGVMGYWTNIETWYVVYGSSSLPDFQIGIGDLPSDLTPPYPAGHENYAYLVFQCESPMDCDNCLDQDDMAFHTQGTYDAMLQIRDYFCCPTKTPISCKVIGNLHFAPPAHAMHTAEFRYGVERRF